MLSSRALVFPKTLKPSLVMQKNILFLERNKQQWHPSNVIDTTNLFSHVNQVLQSLRKSESAIISVIFVSYLDFLIAPQQVCMLALYCCFCLWVFVRRLENAQLGSSMLYPSECSVRSSLLLLHCVWIVFDCISDTIVLQGFKIISLGCVTCSNIHSLFLISLAER